MEKVTTEWPESIVRLAGAWKDLSLAEEDRANLGLDDERAALQARQEAVATRPGKLGKPEVDVFLFCFSVSFRGFRGH